MASASSATLYPCHVCQASRKRFKMMEFENPRTWVERPPETCAEAVREVERCMRYNGEGPAPARRRSPAEASRATAADRAGRTPIDPKWRWLCNEGSDKMKELALSIDEERANPEHVGGTSVRSGGGQQVPAHPLGRAGPGGVQWSENADDHEPGGGQEGGVASEGCDMAEALAAG